MGAIEVRHYLSRARDFLKGMDLLKEDLAAFKYSPALLGIHGSISYCDALRIGMGAGNVSDEDHQRATKELNSHLTSRGLEEKQGIEHMKKLLAYKTHVAYSNERLSERDFKLIIQHAERFALWAERIGSRLNLEGWEDD